MGAEMHDGQESSPDPIKDKIRQDYVALARESGGLSVRSQVDTCAAGEAPSPGGRKDLFADARHGSLAILGLPAAGVAEARGDLALELNSAQAA